MPTTTTTAPDTAHHHPEESDGHAEGDATDRDAPEDASRGHRSSDPAQAARDTLHAAVTVLRGVQRSRYDRTHSALREAMRQTAVAAIEDALTDLSEA